MIGWDISYLSSATAERNMMKLNRSKYSTSFSYYFFSDLLLKQIYEALFYYSA